MPKLPVKLGDLPVVSEDMPEDRPFEVQVKALDMSDEPDKNGHHFLIGKFVVTEPEEWRGKTVTDNWIPIPNEEDYKTPRGAEVGLKLGRLSQSCHKPDTDDTDDLIGEICTIMIRNEEYPEGSGRKLPKVAEYYI